MSSQMIDFSILLPGVPVSSERGSLGWCTVSLIRHRGRCILVDTGSHGDRSVLLEALKSHELTPDLIDDVFVTHLHYDHFLNADLFVKAKIWVPERDLAYVTEGEHRRCCDPYVPAAQVHYLADRLTPYVPDQIIAQDLRVIGMPGHTPGTCGLFYESSRLLFAGDGVKNGSEFLYKLPPPAFFDLESAVANYRKITELGVDIVVPGHDSPFRITPDGGVRYLQTYTAAVRVFSESNPNGKLIRME